MSNLVSVQNLEKAYGHRTLFEGLTFGVAEKERWGVIGANGSGKSTLMRLLARLDAPDGGQVIYRNDLTVAYLAQEESFEPGATIGQLVRGSAAAFRGTDIERDIHVGKLLTQPGFPGPETEVVRLSGGWKKRVAILCQLARGADLLILDEPTNHLDLAGIEWLENLLRTAPFSVMVVTHDRTFLENTSTMVMELNARFPGGIFKVEGNYSRFLERREAFIEAQTQKEASLDSRVRQEIAWLRQGPKARTTKASFRVEQAHSLIKDLEELRNQLQQNNAPEMAFAATHRKTRRLLVARGLKKSFGERTLFQNLDLILTPKMRLGLLGLNGSGKTTLLRILSEELVPDEGTLRTAANLKVVRFDQERRGLPLESTVLKALAPDGDMVMFQGSQIHVRGWAKRFGFSEDFLNMKVGDLSGGEQARILLARLMLEPADLLFLDEPTNDLDLPALEMLEESLERFPGAIVLVTHDRWMLDRLSTLMLGLNGAGEGHFYGDFSQWMSAMRQESTESRSATRPAPQRVRQRSPLSYLEKKEFESIEGDIERAEAAVLLETQMLENPAIATDADKVREHYERLQQAQAEVDRLFARWGELQEKVDRGSAG